ncbi:AAA family ATPase [Priestia megaterium]|uniref:AAA family ATPase n=1 Tax=Priestia megaterium TaxID=1404 RepID=UPI002DBB5CE9|nr:AAA family ATPase [Priestia megaterium]MEC1071322.1 AAA family ATPase [Priestia megaterium]
MNLQDKIDKTYPRYYDYEVGISKEQWKELLQNSSIFNENNLEHMKCLYSFDNHAATCKEVSEKLGGTAQYYIGLATGLARRIAKKLEIERLPARDETDDDAYWYILFYGQEANDRKKGNFQWKLRPALAEALKESYPDLEYPKPMIMKKLEDAPAAIWLATAILAYEIFNRSDKPIKEMMYFKQSNIQKKAQELCKQSVDHARISQWCNADHANHTYNYLRQGEGATRRLSYHGEFNGLKEQPELNGDNLVQTSLGFKTIKEIKQFIVTNYTTIFIDESTNVLMNNIKCISILDYLDTYGGQPYESPEKAEGPKKQHFLDIKAAGSAAVRELDKMAELCEIRFGLKKYGVSKWLNGGNNRARKYLWRQLKLPGYQESPTSLSLFAEIVDGQARFKFSVELNEAQSTKEDYLNHHRLLNRDISDATNRLFYILNGNQSETEMQELSLSTEEIKRRVENGTYKKIQMARVITRSDIKEEFYDDPGIVCGMLQAVESLMPYYQLAVGIDINNEGFTKSRTIDGGKGGKGSMEKSNKNMILYGPPGTGKTYNTVTYAVSIIENQSLQTIQSEDYASVFERYGFYKSQGRIAFTTFHQSYGYEEFIEGIKPVISQQGEETSTDIQYEYASGIFKRFCEKAKEVKVQTSSLRIRENPVVWSVLLGGTGETDLKKDCFEKDYIKIGWANVDEKVTDEMENLNDKERRILLNFQEEMQEGDLVFIPKSKTSIDAIGVITGPYEYDPSYEKYPRTRKVQWIKTDIDEDVYELNKQTKLDRKTVYPLRKMDLKKVTSLIEKYAQSHEINVQENQDPYIFIIDEINRGNISKIFGELITLVELTKRLGEDEAATAILPYTGDEFGVPNNVYILGTMNTADRSIALMDTALRRRFKFIEMMPDENVLKTLNIEDVEGIDVPQMLKTINERIEYLYDREHTIGHAYFTSLAKDPSLKNLASIFLNAIIPLLQEYFYEDYSKIQLVLGDNAKENPTYKFILDTELKVKEVFKGNPDIELPEKNFLIQTDAFYQSESYKLIY